MHLLPIQSNRMLRKKFKIKHTVSTTLSFMSVAALAAFSEVDFFANEVEIKRTRQMIENNLFIFFLSNGNFRFVVNKSENKVIYK